jgi:hypothetical protein
MKWRTSAISIATTASVVTRPITIQTMAGVLTGASYPAGATQRFWARNSWM